MPAAQHKLIQREQRRLADALGVNDQEGVNVVGNFLGIQRYGHHGVLLLEFGHEQPVLFLLGRRQEGHGFFGQRRQRAHDADARAPALGHFLHQPHHEVFQLRFRAGVQHGDCGLAGARHRHQAEVEVWLCAEPPGGLRQKAVALRPFFGV